jgi:hypothetical protein
LPKKPLTKFIFIASLGFELWADYTLVLSQISQFNVNDQSDYDLIELLDSGLEKSLKQPEVEEIQDSMYFFKVALGSAYRKIAVPSTTCLEELAGSILRAFNFDHDHLYEFIYKNRYGITERVVHSSVENMEFIFHIDFGDDWRF